LGPLSDWASRRFRAHEQHPCRLLDRHLPDLAAPGLTILDAGCGRTAPNLQPLTGESVCDQVAEEEKYGGHRDDELPTVMVQPSDRRAL
jgi:hypothetical protein